MDLLLNNKNYKKLVLLNYLAKHPLNNNLKDISIKLNLSIMSTKRIILDLNNDLVTHFSEDIYINMNINSVSLVNSNSNYSSIDLIELLSMFYLKDSISFQILHLFFINNNTTVSQISTELFISRSFCYKTIDELAEPLKGWHIELNLSSKRDSPNFIAKQEHLRIFYLYFFWNTFKNLEWPFESQELILIRQYLSSSKLTLLSSSKLKRIEIYLAITNRMIQEKQFVTLSNTDKQIIQCIADENDLSAPLDKLFHNQHSNYSFIDIENEKYLFNFLIRLLSPGIDNSSQIKSIGNNFFHCKNPTIQRSKVFLDFIIKEFHLVTNQNTFTEIFYYVVFYFFTFEKFNIDYLSFIKTAPHTEKFSINSLENKEFSDTIMNSVDLFFKKDSDHPKDIFYNLAYFIISSLQKKELVVYVQCNKNMHSESFITNKISSIFGNDILKITSFIEEADIVITDSNEHCCGKNQEVYFFEMTHSLDTWQQLTSFLQKKILKLAFM